MVAIERREYTQGQSHLIDRTSAPIHHSIIPKQNQAKMIVQIALAGLIIAVALQPLLSYLQDGHDLRKFPAPSYAGISSLWRILRNLQNKHYEAVHSAHSTLGTHVRIAPNHISVSDPAAMTDIYGHGANFLKDAWYDGGAGEHRNMADARVKAEHAGKRKMLAHVFAQKTLANLEPMIVETVEVLVQQLNTFAQAGQAANLRRYMNYFTIDVFSRLLYSQSLGCLERGDDIVDAETPEGKIYQVPFIRTLHNAMTINTALGMEAGILPLTKKLLAWHPYKKAGADYDNIVYHNTQQRLRRDGSSTPESGPEDIFSKLLTNNKGEPTGISKGDLLAECSVMMNAGTDTTTAALTNTIFLLYKHPMVLKCLRAELDAAAAATFADHDDNDDINKANLLTYDTLSNLPYLRACIEESLRIRPASSMGLPRVVPKGGRTIAGKFVVEGVTVSVPTYTLLRDASCFDEPDAFNPDRWMTEDKAVKERMARAHLPFSTGPRACIGRNIAYFEQLLVVAALVRGFDFDFVQKDFELETIERFNSNPGEMEMWVKKRVVV